MSRRRHGPATHKGDKGNDAGPATEKNSYCASHHCTALSANALALLCVKGSVCVRRPSVKCAHARDVGDVHRDLGNEDL